MTVLKYEHIGESYAFHRMIRLRDRVGPVNDGGPVCKEVDRLIGGSHHERLFSNCGQFSSPINESAVSGCMGKLGLDTKDCRDRRSIAGDDGPQPSRLLR